MSVVLPPKTASRLSLWLLLLWLTIPGPISAHNGAVAIAVPVEGITIDGDLSDWPRDVPVYPIRENTDAYGLTDLSGANLNASLDFSPEFMVGYSREEQLLFVAMRTRDDTLTHRDGCEVYLHDHRHLDREPLQVVREHGGSASLAPGGTGPLDFFLGSRRFRGSGSLSAMGRTGDVTVFEWALNPYGAPGSERVALEPGVTMGFDVVATDADGPDDTQAWVAWTPGIFKISHSERLGDLRLVGSSLELATVEGRVVVDGAVDDDALLTVIAEDGSGALYLAVADSGSAYRLHLPAGAYEFSVLEGRGTDPSEVQVRGGARCSLDLAVAELIPADATSIYRAPTGETGFLLPWSKAMYRVGDDPTWARPDLDDEGWQRPSSSLQEVTLGLPSRTAVWVRHRLDVHPALWSQPVALAGDLIAEFDSLVVYLNGEPVHATGSDAGIIKRMPRMLVLGDRRDQVLALRLSDRVRGSPSDSLTRILDFGLELGDGRGGLIDYVVSVRDQGVVLVLIAGIPLVFAVVHFLLFAFYPKTQQNLYFGLVATCVAALGSGALCLTWGLGDAMGLFLLAGLFALPLASLRLLYSLFYTRVPVVMWAFLFAGGAGLTAFATGAWGGAHAWGAGLGLVVVACIGAIYTGVRRGWSRWYWLLSLGSVASFFFSQLVVTAAFVEIPRILAVSVWRRKRGAATVGLGFLALLLGVAGMVVVIVRAGGGGGWGAIYPLAGGVIGLLAAMSIHLARQVGGTSRDLEYQLQRVEQLSERNLRQERALREEMERELQTAHDLQMGLMPTEPPVVRGLEVAARCVPATQVGGDFFQYFHQGDRLSVSTADVTDHGMEAAIPVVMFDGILDSQVELADELEDLFSRLNERMVSRMPGRTHVCFSMAQIDINTRAARFANAGCPYPFHYRAAMGDLVELRVDAYPLGIREGTTYRAIETQLDAGDRLVFCSDGVMEAQNGAEEMFGFERTAEVIRTGCAEDLPAEGLLERVLSEVRSFSGDRPQEDDMTCVVVRVDS